MLSPSRAERVLQVLAVLLAVAVLWLGYGMLTDPPGGDPIARKAAPVKSRATKPVKRVNKPHYWAAKEGIAVLDTAGQPGP